MNRVSLTLGIKLSFMPGVINPKPFTISPARYVVTRWHLLEAIGANLTPSWGWRVGSWRRVGRAEHVYSLPALK
jgi:hypothetical protein